MLDRIKDLLNECVDKYGKKSKYIQGVQAMHIIDGEMVITRIDNEVLVLKVSYKNHVVYRLENLGTHEMLTDFKHGLWLLKIQNFLKIKN